MLSILRQRCAAIGLAGLASLPLMAPLACEVPLGVELSQGDSDRMSDFATAQLRGLAEALLGDNPDERITVSALFAAGDAPTTSIPDGRYRCRTIKLGGLLPLTVYGYFDCAISDHGSSIEKLTGSQRFKGTLTPSDGALFYRGALHYGDEEPMAYGTEAERDQVGCLVKVNGKPVRYRLDLPFPQFESTHDVIELVPAR